MSSAAPQPVVIVAGPTASGKSALALAIAEAIGGTIINADSMQVYRDLAVLTARPGATELARAPHRLYGVVDAAEACSAGRWRDLALAEIAVAREAGRVPVLTGGSGLYLRALLDGLAPVPPVPAALRAEARALHARLGGEAFRRALAARDPEAAQRLPAGDRQRLIRAYEVVAATGRPLADWRRGRRRAAAAAAGRALRCLRRALPPDDGPGRAARGASVAGARTRSGTAGDACRRRAGAGGSPQGARLAGGSGCG